MVCGAGASYDYYYAARDYQDRFGQGFECWFQKVWQGQLLKAKPDLAWSVLDYDLMGDVNKRDEWLVHIKWHDGTTYAKVGPLPTIVEAARFAAEKMRVRILGSDRRSVLARENSA